MALTMFGGAATMLEAPTAQALLITQRHPLTLMSLLKRLWLSINLKTIKIKSIFG